MAAIGKAWDKWRAGSAADKPKEPVQGLEEEAGPPGGPAHVAAANNRQNKQVSKVADRSMSKVEVGQAVMDYGSKPGLDSDDGEDGGGEDARPTGRFSMLGSMREVADAVTAKKNAAANSITGAVSSFFPDDFDEVGVAVAFQRGARRRVDRVKLWVPEGDIRLQLAELERSKQIAPLYRKVTDAEVEFVANFRGWIDACCSHKDWDMGRLSTADFEIDCLAKIGLLKSYEPIDYAIEDKKPDEALTFVPAETICLCWIVSMWGKGINNFSTKSLSDSIEGSRFIKKYADVLKLSMVMMKTQQLKLVETKEGFELNRLIQIQKMIILCASKNNLQAAEVVMKVCGSQPEEEMGYHLIKILQSEAERKSVQVKETRKKVSMQEPRLHQGRAEKYSERKQNGDDSDGDDAN